MKLLKTIIISLLLTCNLAYADSCLKLISYDQNIFDISHSLVEKYGPKGTEILIEELQDMKSSQSFKQRVWEYYINIFKAKKREFTSTRYILNTNKGKFLIYFGNFKLKGFKNFLVITPEGYILNSELNLELINTVNAIRDFDGSGNWLNDYELNLNFSPTLEERKRIDDSLRQLYPEFFGINERIN